MNERHIDNTRHPRAAEDRSDVRTRRNARVTRTVTYALAFLSLPIAVGFIGVNDVFARIHARPEPFQVDIVPPEHDPTKPTVAVMLSNVWTELGDFLAPYQIMSASGLFNVYAVAPERVLTPLNGVIDVMPHYSIDEFASSGIAPDVVIVPYVAEIHGEANQPLLAWIKARADDGAIVLSICAGAEVVAASGAFEGHRATTIWSSLDTLEKEYPGTEWIRDVRYVDDGPVLSSAGVTSGIDATLYLLQRLHGAEVASEVARNLNYPHARFMNDATQPTSYRMWDLAPMAVHAAYGWDRPAIGVALQPGVSEIDLASIVEFYTAAVATATTVGEHREPIETAHGLHVVPRKTISDAPELDRVIVPGSRSRADAVSRWAEDRRIPVETPHADLQAEGSHYAFDAVILDLARRENRAIAEATAASLEYPIEHLRLEGARRANDLLLRPIALGLLGVGALFGFRRFISGSNSSPAREPAGTTNEAPITRRATRLRQSSG